MFSPTISADYWAPWLVIATLLAPFLLFAVLGRPSAALWTAATELMVFVLAGLFISEWLFLATPWFLALEFATTAICYFAATLSRDLIWRGSPSQKD